MNVDSKSFDPSSPQNVPFTKEAIHAGFLKGKGYTPVVKAAMENKNISFDTNSGKWLVDGNEINTQLKTGFKLIHFERLIHKFKLAFNSSYKLQFEAATKKIVTLYEKTFHPSSSRSLDAPQKLSPEKSQTQQMEQLEEKSHQLKEQIAEKEKGKKEYLSKDIQDIKNSVIDVKKEINTMEDQLKRTELLGTYIEARDNESALDTAIRWFSDIVNEKSKGHEKQEGLLNELSKYLEIDIIIKIKEDSSFGKSLLEKYQEQKESVESDLAAKKCSLKSKEEVLSTIEKENKTVQEHNISIDGEIAPLQIKLKEVETQKETVRKEIQGLRKEKEPEKPVKVVAETLTETDEYINAAEQPAVEEPTVVNYEVDPPDENIQRKLTTEESALYENLTKKEQELFKTICNPLHIEGAHFSVIADLVLLLTKGNLKGYTFDAQTNTLTVQTNKEQSGVKKFGFVTVTLISVPTEMQFKFTNGNWEIIKGPTSSSFELHSINYNEEGEVKIDVTGSNWIPQAMKTFRNSNEVIKDIFKIPQYITLK